MADRQWRILLVEDDEDDFILARDMLKETRDRKYHLEWASTYESGKQMILSDSFDAILMDYELGPRTGLDLTREVTLLGCKVPIILLTGRGSYDVDMEAMHTGVTDYLAKSEATPASLERTIRYAILQKQSEEMMRSAKAELESLVQARTRELSEKNVTLEAEINERKRVEAELAELQRRLLDHAEAERRELARDLHDGPMQDLYGIIFQIDPTLADIASGQVQYQPASQAMKDRLLQVIQSLRSISRELRPPALAPYGLEKAIRSHAEGIQQAHPDLLITLHLDSDGQALPEDMRMALFRIYQTSITNVIRHASATKAEILFRLHNGYIQLEILDNGCGFNVPERWIELARKGHMGLVGAAERAEAAGGKLKVDSQPGKGTRIQVTIPRSEK